MDPERPCDVLAIAPPSPRWRASADTLICRHGDTATLLSTRSWQYFGLNPTAYRAWERLTQGDDEVTAAAVVAADYGVEAGEVRGDIAALTATLARLGFLEDRGTADTRPSGARWAPPPVAARRATAVPSLAACLGALIDTGLRLRRQGLDPQAWLADDTAAPSGVLSPAERRDATWQLLRAAAWLPVRTFCLQQSLALVAVLRRAGVDARLRLGARPYPFVAHAWVVADGAPVNESDEQLAMYAPFRPAAPRA